MESTKKTRAQIKQDITDKAMKIWNERANVKVTKEWDGGNIQVRIVWDGAQMVSVGEVLNCPGVEPADF